MATVAQDNFKEYFQEKLWELIPSVYLNEDGLNTNTNPHVLRAIIEIMAEQAAVLRRSQDRLWEDQSIEWCNDWAVPYIGDLLGTRLLSALNKRARRIDVAKTIYYRRRKGTPRILEELIHDISGWEGKLVEGFTRLLRTRHGLDADPELLLGLFTGTPAGGTPDLRAAVASELSDGPFEEYYHSPDFRKPGGLDGRYGINKLNFYLYRVFAYPVTNVSPFKKSATEFLFDPSGREIHLFAKRKRPDGDEWKHWNFSKEWELPSPIRCRLLAHSGFIITDTVIGQLLTAGFTAAQGDQLRTLNGLLFRNEQELLIQTGFLNASEFLLLIKYSLIQECGKSQLIPGSISVTINPPATPVPNELITAGSLMNPGALLTNKQLVIDPVPGRFMFFNLAAPATKVVASYYYGFPGPLGAGTYDRKAVEKSEPTAEIVPASATIDLGSFSGTEVVQIVDNSTYSVTTNPPTLQKFVFQVANQKRPYVQMSSHLSFKGGNDATLVLDGLWFGSPGNQIFRIILNGDFESVIIRNCTFDPGIDTNGNLEAINPVVLSIEGTIENLCIDKSIIGPIIQGNNGIIEEEIRICDSIIHSADSNVDAINMSTGQLTLNRCTVFGKVKVHRLYASEVLATDDITVIDTQTGCFRFSAGRDTSRIPRPYESYLFKSDSPHWFTSKRFGHYSYGQLSDAAPREIYRGGENGAEMGAYNSLLNAIKLDGLQAKVEEYMPFGLIPSFINRT